MREWKVEGVGEWKCEESWGCLDWGMLEWICEESLLKYVSDVMVVRIFWIILKCVNCKITNLPLCKLMYLDNFNIIYDSLNYIHLQIYSYL